MSNNDGLGALGAQVLIPFVGAATTGTMLLATAISFSSQGNEGQYPYTKDGVLQRYDISPRDGRIGSAEMRAIKSLHSPRQVEQIKQVLAPKPKETTSDIPQQDWSEVLDPSQFHDPQNPENMSALFIED